MTNEEFWYEMTCKWQEIEQLRAEYNNLGAEYAKNCTDPNLVGKKVRVGRLGVEGIYVGYEHKCGVLYLRLSKINKDGRASSFSQVFPTIDPAADKVEEI